MRWLGIAAGLFAMAGMDAGAATAGQTVQAPAGYAPVQALAFGAVGGAAVAVDDGHALPVAPHGRTVTYVDRSGTIAAASVAQVLAPANGARGGFFVQNLSTADLWVTSIGAATASQPSIRIGAGQLYEFPESGVPGAALSILGATAGQDFAAREW